MASFKATLLLASIVGFLLVGCDQFGSRYEISKDQKGRTLRIDKRTGEIAVIEGDKIVPLKDARDSESREKETSDRVGKFKYWPTQELKQFNIRVRLTTVWRDGKMLYSVEFRPSSRKPEKVGAASVEKDDEKKNTKPQVDAEKIIRAVVNRRFDLILEDAPFELAKEQLKFSLVVSENNKIVGQDAKGQIPMSRETYEKIDVWNIHWY